MTPGNKALSCALVNIIQDYTWAEAQYNHEVTVMQADLAVHQVPRAESIQNLTKYATVMKTLDDVIQHILDQMFDDERDVDTEADMYKQLPQVVQEYCKKRKQG